MIIIEDPKLVNKVWERWLDENVKFSQPQHQNRIKNYLNVSKYSNESKRFEGWLFEQNVMVKQINKKKYLQFFDEHDATLFVLKWI